MGMFDTVIFQKPIHCKCGEKIESTQVKLFDNALMKYRVGDIVHIGPFMSILEDTAWCYKCGSRTKIYIALNYQIYLGVFTELIVAKDCIDSFDMMSLWKIYMAKSTTITSLFKLNAEFFLQKMLEKLSKDKDEKSLFGFYDEYFENTDDPKEMIQRFLNKNIIIKTIQSLYSERCEFEIEYLKKDGDTFVINKSVQDKTQKEYIYKLEGDIGSSEIVFQVQEWLTSHHVPLKVVLKSNSIRAKKEMFLDEIVAVYKKHNYSLAHEDTQGAFEIQSIKDENIEWLKECLLLEERK